MKILSSKGLFIKRAFGGKKFLYPFMTRELYKNCNMKTNPVVGDSWQCLWDSKCCSSFLGTLTNWHFSTSQLNQGTPHVHQRKKLLCHFSMIYVHLPSQVIVMCKSYVTLKTSEQGSVFKCFL